MISLRKSRSVLLPALLLGPTSVAQAQSPLVSDPLREMHAAPASALFALLQRLPSRPLDWTDQAPSDEKEEVFLLPPGSLPELNLASLSRSFQPNQAPSSPPKPVIVEKFRRLRWSPQTNAFRSEGSVRIQYPRAQGGAPVTLTASDLQYDAENQEVTARGGIELKRADGTITGQEIKYNFASNSGYITEALAVSDYFRMSGKRIETGSDGSYIINNGVFTTCTHGRPDYQIRAGYLSIKPNRVVTARKITLYAGGTRLFTLPTFRRNLQASSELSTPLPGYTRAEGLIFRLRDTPIAEPNATLDYDLRLNLKRIPAGLVSYQRDLWRTSASGLPARGLLPNLEDPLHGFLDQLVPPTFREYSNNRFEESYAPRNTFFAVLQNDQYVFNRRRNDLLTSRFPEVGIRFANLLGQPLPQAQNEPLPTGYTAGSLRRIPNAPFLLDVTPSVGAFRELPTRATDGRFSLRVDAASQPWLLGRRLSLRVGATNWLNLYTKGTLYNLFSPEVELNYIPTQTSLLGVGYRFAEDAGRTPFFFDRRDIRHELRLRYQVGGPWAFGIVTRYDLERSRAYDSEFVLLRNTDCLQIGLAYRVRSQSISLVFNLLPPSPNRESERRPPLEPVPQQ